MDPNTNVGNRTLILGQRCCRMVAPIITLAPIAPSDQSSAHAGSPSLRNRNAKVMSGRRLHVELIRQRPQRAEIAASKVL